MTSPLRVSCGSMCRFHVEDKFLLILNRNRRKKGIYQLSPIGGAIAFDDETILKRFGMRLEKTDVNDLRFYTNTEHIDDFREWFYRREGREIDPFREIYEELVEEEGVLDDIRRDSLTIEFTHILEDSKATQRTGSTGLFTQYFFELFDVNVVDAGLCKQLEKLDRELGVILLDKATLREKKMLEQTFDGKIRETKLVTEYLFR